MCVCDPMRQCPDGTSTHMLQRGKGAAVRPRARQRPAVAKRPREPQANSGGTASRKTKKTKKRELAQPAQDSLAFLAAAQEPEAESDSD